MRALRIAVGLWLLIGTAVAQTAADTEAELLRHTNVQRELNGLVALAPDEALSVAARRHALEMAELGYLAHESPSEANRTLSDRLNLAGAIVQGAGENLALLSHVPDVAAAAVSGWMDSPGHRANLLGNYTHVGFGVAANAQGDTWVVQVLGLKTVRIGELAVGRVSERVLRLEIGMQLSEAREVAFWLGTEVSDVHAFGPGAQVFMTDIAEPQLMHVNSGTRPLGAADDAAFIAADGGWFDPVSGWNPSGGMHTGILRIDSVTGEWVEREGLRARIRFLADPGSRPGAWLDDEWLQQTQWDGRDLLVALPADAFGRDLQIGVEAAQGDGTFQIVASLTPAVNGAGEPVLLIRNR